MREGIVEVGPVTIRGTCVAPTALASAALDYLDDDIALVDDQPVDVAALWRELFRTVLLEPVETAVLVCPTWWPSARIARVREAAAVRSADVVVLRRAEVLAEHVQSISAVVEIAPDVTVTWRDGRIVAAIPRLGEIEDMARAIVGGISSATMVLVDAPAGVAGAAELAAAIAGSLRADGITAATVHPDRVLAVPQRPPTPPERAADSTGRTVPRKLVVAAASIALLCVGLGAGTEFPGSGGPEAPMTLLVEGRVALKVPALWAVQRITSGPGSARVQVTAPDSATAILVTQSPARQGEPLSTTAATLRSALHDQQAGVFNDFNPDDRRADRAVATYREDRDGRQIDWVVFVDRAVRIGIGCQSRRGEHHVVRDACDEAVRSAHALH